MAANIKIIEQPDLFLIFFKELKKVNSFPETPDKKDFKICLSLHSQN